MCKVNAKLEPETITLSFLWNRTWKNQNQTISKDTKQDELPVGILEWLPDVRHQFNDVMHKIYLAHRSNIIYFKVLKGTDLQTFCRKMKDLTRMKNISRICNRGKKRAQAHRTQFHGQKRNAYLPAA